MYHKSIISIRLEAKRRRCAAMRAAKERKRFAYATESLEVGRIVFSGQMFGGATHILTCRLRDGDQAYQVDIDGKPYGIKTRRGMRGLIARRIGL